MINFQNLTPFKFVLEILEFKLTELVFILYSNSKACCLSYYYYLNFYVKNTY